MTRGRQTLTEEPADLMQKSWRVPGSAAAEAHATGAPPRCLLAGPRTVESHIETCHYQSSHGIKIPADLIGACMNTNRPYVKELGGPGGNGEGCEPTLTGKPADVGLSLFLGRGVVGSMCR